MCYSRCCQAAAGLTHLLPLQVCENTVSKGVNVLSCSACALQLLGVFLRGDTDWHVTLMEQDHDVVAGGSAVGIESPTPLSMVSRTFSDIPFRYPSECLLMRILCPFV